MFSQRPESTRARPSRILLDVVEGRLSEDELEAVVAWLQTEAEAPPRHLMDRVAGPRRAALAGLR